MKIQKLFYILLFLSCNLLLVLSSCGYSLHTKASLPFDAIRIGSIENKTLEPKLQDGLNRSLTGEFLKHGISVQNNAAYKLEGVIHKFELRVLSEKSEVASEYEVAIKGDFRLVDPAGKIKEFKDIGSPFIVSFYGSGKLNELIAYKEQAAERALKEMAAEIVATLLYR